MYFFLLSFSAFALVLPGDDDYYAEYIRFSETERNELTHLATLSFLHRS